MGPACMFRQSTYLIAHLNIMHALPKDRVNSPETLQDLQCPTVDHVCMACASTTALLIDYLGRHIELRCPAGGHESRGSCADDQQVSIRCWGH